MDKSQAQILDFMNKAGQESPAKPVAPDAKTRILRIKLLLEEVLELAVASGVEILVDCETDLVGDDLQYSTHDLVDLVEVADALADIKYVNEGAANAYGIDLEPVFDEVHDSNMSKWWKLDELNGRPEGSTVTSLGGALYCVRNAAGKVLKSPTYRPAEIAPIIARQQA